MKCDEERQRHELDNHPCARILQQSGLRALPVTEDGELVGMLTIEDVGHASLLRQPTRK